MRSTTAYYLLILYITVMFQPLIPVIYDALSHTFDEANHIATVHARFGNNHLEIALGKTSDAGKNQNSLKDENQVLVHISTSAYNHLFYSATIITNFNLLELSKLPGIFLLKHTPPPKFSC